MGKMLEKYAGSISFWILVVVAVYLGYAVYFAVYGLQFSVQRSQDQYVYDLISKNSLWWQVTYYLSEGVTGSIAIVLRAFAACFAFYAAFLYWRKKNTSIATIRKNVTHALILEAGFFLAIIPSVIAAFAYNLTSEYLFYFDHTPEHIVLFGTAIPCLAIVLTVPPLLLKLRTKIKDNSPKEVILKWASLAGLGYLFVVFWFNYSMLWAANMVPYPRVDQVYGFGFLLQPTNFVSFVVTVFGLLAIAAAGAFTLRSVIEQIPAKVNLTQLGAVITAFSAYFIFNTIYYTLTGGYQAHPSVWYEVISPMHNPNLWVAALILVGVPLIALGTIKKRING
jgi:hypothetical protein